MPTVVYKTNPYLAIFEHGSGAKRFDFNGVDQYATFPPWAADGKPRMYVFSFIADAVATGAEQHILSGVEGGIELSFYLHATLPNLTIEYRSSTGTQAIEGLLDLDIIAGDRYRVVVENLGTGSTIRVNGEIIDLTAFDASDGLQPPLTHIGAKHDVTGFFGGTIWSSELHDDSPIHDTYANMGDGSRYGQLEQSIVLADSFEISVDLIRSSGTVLQPIVGDEGSIINRFFCWGTAGANLDSVEVTDSRGVRYIWTGSLANVASGQHFNLKLSCYIGSAPKLFVDGVEATVGVALWVGDLRISTIAAVDSQTILMPAGTALQHIVITQPLTAPSYSWNYPLDEGPTTDTGPELISGAPTLIGGLASWDGSTLHLEGTNSSGTFEGAGVVDGGDYHVTFDYNTSAANTYIRVGGGGNLAIIAGPAIGTYDEVLSAQGTGYVLNIASDNNQGDFTNFSVKSATGGDIIHNIDPSTQGNYLDQPLWDTVANFGDGARYGELEQAIVLEGDVDISWDCIKSDPESGEWTVILGGTANNRDYILYRGATDATFPDRLQVYDSASNVILATTGALSGVAAGQHYNGRLTIIDEGSGTVARMYVDGVQVAVNTPPAYAGFSFSRIGGADGLGKLPPGSALQNIVITQPNGPNYTWDYGLDEGSGTDIINSDPSTPGYNGSWTPDTDWQPTGSYTNNGAWVPDTDWQFIADNSRFYPMNEGTGDVFKAYDEQGVPTPVNDATIQGYTDNWG